ncbi:esterase-like activity of phytase family protein [Shimia sp. NS0008-38b]|uniref:esterase-like activity of phytase family protein n=1 Tax=Shimia sp. NS0008-38b TaxID=3127653 RepID=UPI00333F7D86
MLGIHTLWANTAKTDRYAAQHLATYRWQIAEGWFGGFSGLEISRDGHSLLSVSDRGQFVQAELVRENGVITNVEQIRHARVLLSDGRFAKRAGLRDTEGITLLPDGSIAVVFEGDHRLERFAKPGSTPSPMPWHRDFDQMALNAGFEALASTDAGTIYALPEKAISRENVIQVFVLEGSTWRKAFNLKRDKQFQPVGADFGPDGRLYVLERGFNGFGFRTRARSFVLTDNGVSDEKLLFQKAIAVHDNLEGLSVWRDPNGRIRLTMISDDNFRLIQRTEIVEYVLNQ